MTDADKRLPARRIESEARERVAQTLTHHFAADHIDDEELEARLARVYDAATAAELEAVVADLPAIVAGPVAVAVKPTSRRISALFSAQEQQLTGVVPRRLEIRGRLGYVELDLTQATFDPGLTEIDVRAFMGYVQIRFPADVQVDNCGNALFGFFSLHGPGAASSSRAVPSPCRVRITGRADFGFAEFVVQKDKKALPPVSEETD
jgi:hypothetical protein